MAVFYLAIVVSVLFCLAFHKVPLILNASFGGNGGVSYTFSYSTPLVVLLWLAFLSVSLSVVCFLGVVNMSQPVAG